jgi:hypothetical protein
MSVSSNFLFFYHFSLERPIFGSPIRVKASSKSIQEMRIDIEAELD